MYEVRQRGNVMERIEQFSNMETIIAPYTTDPDERLIIAKILSKMIANAREGIRNTHYGMMIDNMEHVVYYLSRFAAYGYFTEEMIRRELWPLVVVKMKLLKRNRSNRVRRHAVRSLFMNAMKCGFQKPLPLIMKESCQ